MSLLAAKEGILTTVQDLGRYEYQRFGVNPSGAMDRTACRLVNELLRNDPNAAVLEMHFPAGEYLFESDTKFAIGGADFGVELSGATLANWSVCSANAGELLGFRRKNLGERAYLAVPGGFEVTRWLGSSSTSLVTSTGGYQGRRLLTGDRLRWHSCNEKLGARPERKLGYSLLPPYTQHPIVRATRGPEFDMMTASSIETLFSERFVVSKNSDRMGFRLNGPSLFKLSDTELLSSGTTFGTVQLLPDGQLIALMADHQTTGGYPRVLTIVSVDVPLAAQLGPGDDLSFELIDIAQAEELAAEFERRVSFLRFGVNVAIGRL
jgi:antagonist of KipI